MEIKKILGQRIRQLRDKMGMSQKDLAFDSDLDRSYIASVENGQRNVSIVNITKIAIALKVSLKEFFNDEEFNQFTGSPE
jgi:transcriptional regulator with XRE-family HTH domain